jgi:hypothetical protein
MCGGRKRRRSKGKHIKENFRQDQKDVFKCFFALIISDLWYTFLVQYTAIEGGRLVSQKGGDAHGGQRCYLLNDHVRHVHSGVTYLHEKEIDRPDQR